MNIEEIVNVLNKNISDECLQKPYHHRTNPIMGVLNFRNIICDLGIKKEKDVIFNGLQIPGFQYIDNNKKYTIIKNVTKLQIVKYYTTLMVNNKEDWSKYVDCPQIFDVLEICINHIDDYKDTLVYMKIKSFINCIYGFFMTNADDTINMSENLVSYNANKIGKDIVEHFSVVYADVDTFFIPNFESLYNKDELDNYFKNNKLVYVSENVGDCIFFHHKRYITGLSYNECKGFKEK